MTPAKELRAAAAKLRAAAEHATPGPWQTGGIGDDGWTVSVTDHKIGDWESLAIETSDSERGRADAAWIALMHPGLAKPLADWLDSWTGIEINEHGPMVEDLRYALAIARVINGEEVSR